MAPSRLLALLLSALALSPAFILQASAQDADVVVEDVVVEDASGGAEEVKGEESEEDKEARATAFADSAKELQEKLGQLKALLDKKGESADPALKERLKGLETQLDSLGLGLGGGVGATKELTEFLGGCVAMSMRRAGVRRPSTLGALRKMAKGGLTQADAAGTELFRMVGVCVADLTDVELGQFKSGKLTVLPQAMADKAGKPEGKETVTGMEASIYKELKVVSNALLTTFAGDDEGAGLPKYAGILAGIPVLGIFVFLGKKFMDMQKRGEEAKAKKTSKKEGKKSK